MPKLFTIKDFINYNNICIGCDSTTSIHIGIFANDVKYNTNLIRPEFINNSIKIPLIITYFNNDTNLYIELNSNKFSTDEVIFQKFIINNNLFLKSKCSKCQTEIISEDLTFDLSAMHVNAVELRQETLWINNTTLIISDYYFKTSFLRFWLSDSMPINVNEIKLPIMPRSLFKNNKHAMDKIKLYLTYS